MYCYFPLTYELQATCSQGFGESVKLVDNDLEVVFEAGAIYRVGHSANHMVNIRSVLDNETTVHPTIVIATELEGSPQKLKEFV